MAKVNKNAPKYVVGLDIGTTKIAVVVGCETPEGKIDIVGYGSPRLPRPTLWISAGA